LREALADCNESLRLDGNDPDTLASRGFTYLKLGQFADAIVDYDAALKVVPNHASALYGRGVVKLKQGDVEGGNADIATATAIQADIADKFAIYGVAPVVETVSATPAQGAAKPAEDAVAERAPGSATPPQSAARPAGDCARAETHWKSVEDLKSLAAYEDHLARFPNCEFATLARLRINTLKR
jgi:tetratricopeptide (TPR) repeat protein